MPKEIDDTIRGKTKDDVAKENEQDESDRETSTEEDNANDE